MATPNELAAAGPTTIAPEATPANPSVVSLAVTVVVWASLSVTDAVAWPALKLAVAGYTGALPFGELAGPEKLMLLVPDRVPGVLPQASCAVSVTLNAVPAVCGVAALAAIWWLAPAPTAIEPEVPVAALWAAVRVVLCASNNVTDAVPTPPEKLTELGYVGAVPPGELDGPEKVIACEPV